jgi:hypothetical protein
MKFGIAEFNPGMFHPWWKSICSMGMRLSHYCILAFIPKGFKLLAPAGPLNGAL